MSLENEESITFNQETYSVYVIPHILLLYCQKAGEIAMYHSIYGRAERDDFISDIQGHLNDYPQDAP